MAEKLGEITSEINSLVHQLGSAAWGAGILLLGNNASVEQVSNLLSRQWRIDKEILKNAMNRVKKPT